VLPFLAKRACNRRACALFVALACVSMAHVANSQTAALFWEAEPGPTSGIAPLDGILGVSGNYVYIGGSTSLYRTSGTPESTGQIVPLPVGLSNPRDFLRVGNLTYFLADTAQGVVVGRTNDSPDGVFALNKNYTDPQSLTAAGGKLFFVARTASAGLELWVSDGTRDGTRIVRNIRGGSSSARPFHLAEFNGLLYFTATNAQYGSELWRSDGILANTTLVADLFPGPRGGNPADLTVLGGKLYFSAETLETGRELFASNGTGVGTQLVVDLNQTEAYAFSGAPFQIRKVGKRLFFTAYDPVAGMEYHTSDGTAAGTRLVTNLNPETPNLYAGGIFPVVLGADDEMLFFYARVNATDLYLCRTDGTEAGTVKLLQLESAAGRTYSTPSSAYLASNGILYFRLVDTTGSAALWRSDGTPQGTVQVRKDTSSGGEGFNPRSITEIDSALLFAATTSATGTEVFSIQLPPVATEFGPVGSIRVNRTPVVFRIVFNTPVEGLDLSDFAVFATGLNGASLNTIQAENDRTYRIYVNTGSGEGTVSLRLLDNGSITGRGGAPLEGVRSEDGTRDSSDAFIVDRTAPVPVLSTTAPNPTQQAPIPFRVTLSETVTGFTADDVAITGGGVGSFSLSGLIANFTVLPAAPGLITVQVPTGVFLDLAGNLNAPSNSIAILYQSDGTEGEGSTEGEGGGEGEGSTEGEGVFDRIHSADQDGDGIISLSELLRLIQFFNVGSFHCDAGSEDGYAPGPGLTNCNQHASDYSPQDWVISLSELLRAIQFFNTGGYHPCIEGEDGFCPGP